jgi:hypothetical protein
VAGRVTTFGPTGEYLLDYRVQGFLNIVGLAPSLSSPLFFRQQDVSLSQSSSVSLVELTDG